MTVNKQAHPPKVSNEEMLAAHNAIASRLTLAGIPTTINTFDAMNLFALVGRSLHTVEKQIRPQLRAQIRNMGERHRADGKPTAESLLIAMLIASWDGGDDNMATAFEDAVRHR